MCQMLPCCDFDIYLLIFLKWKQQLFLFCFLPFLPAYLQDQPAGARPGGGVGPHCPLFIFILLLLRAALVVGQPDYYVCRLLHMPIIRYADYYVITDYQADYQRQKSRKKISSTVMMQRTSVSSVTNLHALDQLGSSQPFLPVLRVSKLFMAFPVVFLGFLFQFFSLDIYDGNER